MMFEVVMETKKPNEERSGDGKMEKRQGGVSVSDVDTKRWE
jgi:hypothetical protein